MKKRITTTEAPYFAANTQDAEYLGAPRRSRLARRLGKVAAVSVVAASMLGIASADSAAKLDASPLPETTRTVIDTHYVPVDTNEAMGMIVKQQPTITVEQAVSTGFRVGNLNDSQRHDIDTSMQETVDYLRHDPAATATLVVEGWASDESRADSVNGDVNIGKPSLLNQKLAEERRDLTYESALSYVHEFSGRLKIEKGEAREAVLTPQEQARVVAVAADHMLSNDEFMAAYQNDRSSLNLSKSEQADLYTMIDSRQGSSIKRFYNPTGIDPTSPTVMVQREMTTERQEVIKNDSPYDGRKGIDLLPLFATPALAVSALALRRRRNKQSVDISETPWWSEPRPELTPYAQDGRFEDTVGTVMQRGREIPRVNRWDRLHADGTMLGYMKRRGAELYKEAVTGYTYEGKHRKLGRNALVAASVVGGLASFIPVSAGAPDSEYVQPVVMETDKTIVKTTPAHAEYKRWKFAGLEAVFGKLRRPVIATETIPEAVMTTPKPHVTNVYTFDVHGNLLSDR